MIEDSVENFVLQWKPYAAAVQVYPKVEGSPLLECFANGRVFYLFERTSPYESSLGTRQVIIHPIAEDLKLIKATKKEISIIGVSQLQAKGLIVYRSKHIAVVDAGIPLVVGSFKALEDEVVTGEWLEVTSIEPMHGFVIPLERREKRFEEADEI